MTPNESKVKVKVVMPRGSDFIHPSLEGGSRPDTFLLKKYCTTSRLEGSSQSRFEKEALALCSSGSVWGMGRDTPRSVAAPETWGSWKKDTFQP